MAITNPNLAYSPLYDVYVDRNTHVIYKRNNRHRKSEITDDELVLVKLYVKYNDYIEIVGNANHRQYRVGIHRVYADACPELIENHELHELDPETYCEIDHKSHVHNTLDSNWCDNLRWVSPRINRADTCRRVTKPEDEKHLKRLIYHRNHYAEKKNDPEWIAKRRAKDAERKRKYHHANKDKRNAEADLLNAQMAKLAGVSNAK